MPPGGVILSRTRRINPEQPSEGPEPTWAEDFGANSRLFLDDMPYVQRQRRNAAYKDVVDRLRERKVAEADEWFTLTNEANLLPVVGMWQDYWDGAKVWEVVERDRRAAIQRGEKDPYADLPATREEFEKQIETRERAVERGLVSTGGSTRQADQATVARSSRVLPGLAAGLTTSFADPLNLATLPIGGASKTIAQAAVRNAVINMAIETVQLPGVAAQRERMDETLTVEEAGLRIGSAAAFGALLGGGGKILADNWGGIKGAPSAVQERAWASILDRTPGLREKVGSTIDWDALDDHLPDIARGLISPERLTDAERGAIAALERDGAFARANPFVPDGAGIESHNRLLGETLQGIINDTPTYVPKTRPSPRARLRGSTSVASGVAGDAMQTVKARIGVVESGGSATAKNPRSSAMGLYQFTNGTWLAYYKARFGSQGLSDAAIIAKKGDTGLQNTLMDDLLADNAKGLQEAGFAVDPGNLYLAHFAGRKGATGLLGADPATPAVRVLGEDVINANPFLRGKTAGEVIAWAHGKMGGKAPAVASRAGPDASSEIVAALDRELADTQAELARLDSEIEAAARPAPDVIEDLTPDAVRAIDEPPLPRIEAPDGTRAPIGPNGRAEVAGMTPEARGLIPPLRGIVSRERDVSLADTATLSARLGTDERNLRTALQQMAIDGLIVQKRDGSFARFPQRKSGPEDVLTFVASRGGLADTEGHALAGIFEVEREVRWKRRPGPDGTGGIPLKQPYRTTRPALIPGIGPIVRRDTGNTVDDIGEQLWEAGYFGPMDSVPRPTERQVIDLLENAFRSGKKVYAVGDLAEAAEREAAAMASGYADPKNPFASDFQSEEHFLFEWTHFDSTADEAFGITLDQEAFIAAWGEYRTAGDGDVRAAVVKAIQREIDDVQARMIAERGVDDAEDIIAEWEAALRQDGILGGEDGGRPLFEPGDPGPSGPPRGPAEWEETGPLDPGRWQHWDEPDGPAAKIDTDSMEHDLRVQVSSQADAAPTIATLRPDADEDAMFAAMRDLPDTEASQELLAAARSRLWGAADDADGVDGVIGRFDAARDRWDAQFEAAREAESAANIAAMAERQAALADAIAERVNAGRAVLATRNPVRNQIRGYGPGTVRVRNRQLEVVEGNKWVGIPGNELEGYAAVMGIRLGDDMPTITTAADGQADFAAPTGEQVRTALERQTEGGIRPTGEQKAPGSDGGLFDTRAPESDLFDGTTFRLDEEGDVVNPADLLAEFDEDAAFIKSIRDCL